MAKARGRTWAVTMLSEDAQRAAFAIASTHALGQLAALAAAMLTIMNLADAPPKNDVLLALEPLLAELVEAHLVLAELEPEETDTDGEQSH